MKDTILKFITEEIEIGDGSLTAESELFTSNLMDSISLTMLISYLEDTFDVYIDSSDVTLENFNTIHRICAFLAQKSEASGA